MEHSFTLEKILLVDDQPELLTLVREILTDDGFYASGQRRYG